VRPHPELALVSLGFQVVDWCETMLCHGPGDIAEEPLEIDDELAGFVVACYALNPELGRRLESEGMLSRCKGLAKSEIAGMYACAEALGPVRFDHWAQRGEVSSWGYEYDEGEPVGRSVRSPFVRILATEEGQTGNTYDNVVMMLSKGRIASEVPGLDVGLTRSIVPGSGKIEPCTAGSASKDGGKETFAVSDEPHLYVLPNLKQMYQTVSRNLTKRKAAEPWMLLTSTWFSPGELSIAEAKHTQAKAIADGKIKNYGLLYDHMYAEPPKNPADDRAVLKALREAAGGAAGWMDHEARLAKIRDPETDWDDACRYFFNTLHAAAEDYVELVLWRALVVEGALADGDSVGLGFDGSDSGGDLTALVAVRWPDWHVEQLQSWEKPKGAKPDWRVPRLEVTDAVRAAFERFNVVKMLADPPYWRTEIDEWAAEFGDAKVKAYPTFSDVKMATAGDRFVTMVRAGQLTHAGDELLDTHVGNARRHKTRSGFRPVKKAERRHIDCLLATILACEALGQAVAGDELESDDNPVFAA